MKKDKYQYTISLLDHDNEKDWESYVKIGEAVYPKEFSVLNDEAEKMGGWDNYLDENGRVFLDDVIFLEKDGKRIGCAVVATQTALYKDISVRKNTLCLKYLMIDPQQSDDNTTKILLDGVLEYAKDNDYEQLEFFTDIYTKKFKASHNIFMKNGANGVRVFESGREKNRDIKKVFFRCDVNTEYRDYSKAVFESFKRLCKKDLTALDEHILADELSKRYTDLVKARKKLTREEIEAIRKDPIFNDLSISLKDMIRNKQEVNPVKNTINWLKYNRVIKTISRVFKPNTTPNELSRVQHIDKVERILCGVEDQMTNEQNINRLKNNEDCGILKRL